MEKTGNSFFTVKDSATQQQIEVNNAAFLTPLQEKMMSTQPDLILKYAHHLAEVFEKKGLENPRVYAEVYVTLNGEPSRLYVDSTVNLAAKKLSWYSYDWVVPYNRPI